MLDFSYRSLQRSAPITLAVVTKAKRNTENNERFLPQLNSGFHRDNGAVKWQQSSEGREGESRVR